jgi:hypothetical protein
MIPSAHNQFWIVDTANSYLTTAVTKFEGHIGWLLFALLWLSWACGRVGDF